MVTQGTLQGHLGRILAGLIALSLIVFDSARPRGPRICDRQLYCLHGSF